MVQSLDFLFFLGNGSNHHQHPLAFQLGHLLRASELFQFHRKTQKQFLALLRVNDATALEKDGGFDLAAFLKEALGMFELEIEIMFVGIRTETNLLDHNLGGVVLHLLGLLALLVQIFLVVQNLAYRRNRLVGNLHKIKFKSVGKVQSLAKRVYPGFGDVVPYQANLRRGYFLVDGKFILSPLFGERLIPVVVVLGPRGRFGTKSRFERCSDKKGPPTYLAVVLLRSILIL